eukprot:TRINITY_DN5564_c0_g3_i1.p1 TRINITY_DN5564_c0_g3~~TRINITY_DN5564_c0_g3_i1.p1  ORF type:complete len:289 (-),score=50.24 TRINITY_DN5564_c0_g3_i1:52-855(-)
MAATDAQHDGLSKAEMKSLLSSDEVQRALMEELCLEVDPDDVVIGHVSKKLSHLNTSIRKGMLHRAFSVFLFNSKGELLLQQRSKDKLTFPENWTNTCCSHPLYNVDWQNTEHPHITHPADWEAGESVTGVKRAAIRKLWHELGIKSADLPPADSFHYVTRIHYKSENGSADGIWGEHEIDYILFVQADVELELRAGEVKDVKFVSQSALRDFVASASSSSSASGQVTLTPWFRLCVETGMLYQWWDAFLAGRLAEHFDHDKIQRLL